MNTNKKSQNDIERYAITGPTANISREDML